MARPAQISPRLPISSEKIAAARYVGSPEHKAKRWWGGLPTVKIKQGVASRPKKQHTTICPLTASHQRDTATTWVRTALRNRQYLFRDGDKDYPKHIWHQDENGQFWFGFSINQVQGTYKGWPVAEDEKREIFD